MRVVFCLTIATIGHFLIAALIPANSQPKSITPRFDQHGESLPDHALLRIGTSKLRNIAMPQQMAFTNGTAELVTIDQGTGVHRWDISRGQEQNCFGRFHSGYSPYAVSADGKLAALVESLEVCGIYETKTGQLLHALKGTWDSSQKLAFSHDNKLLFSSSTDSKACLWDIASGVLKERWDTRESDWRRLNVSFSPDGNLLALGSWYGSVTLREIASGREWLVGPKTGGCSVLAFSPDSKMLVTISADPRLCTLWEIATGKQIHVFPPEAGGYSCAVFTPDGKFVVTGNASDPVSFWDVTTGKLQRQISSQTGQIENLAFSADGKHLATASGGCTIRVWEVNSGKQLHCFAGHHTEVEVAQFTRDGAAIVSLRKPWYGGSIFQIHDVASGRMLQQHDEDPKHLAAWLTSSDPMVAVLSGERNIVLRNAITRADSPAIDPGEGTVQSWQLSKDGRVIAAVVGTPPRPEMPQTIPGYFKAWDTLTGAMLVSNAAKERESFTCQLTDDGRYLAVLTSVSRYSSAEIFMLGGGVLPPGLRPAEVPNSSTASSVSFWELSAGRKSHRVGPALTPPRLGTFSPSGRLMAVQELDGKFSVLELGTSNAVRELKTDVDKLVCVAFAPNGQMIAAASESGYVYLWDLVADKHLTRLAGTQQGIRAFCFSQDGSRLLSCARDTTMLVWDVSLWTAQNKKPIVPPATQDVTALWRELGDTKSATAYAAINRLAQSPKDAIAIIRKEMSPAKAQRTDDVNQWIATLNSQSFKEREVASANLRKLGHLAESALEIALKGKPSLEAQRRLEQLLSNLATKPLPSEQLQQLRALEALELIATPDALELLDSLSLGAPDAWLTQEVVWTMKRIKNREIAKIVKQGL